MTGPLVSSVLRALFARCISAAQVMSPLSSVGARAASRSIVALVMLAAQVVQPTSAPASAASAAPAPAGKPFVAFVPADYVRQAGAPPTSAATFNVLHPAT